MYENFLAGMHGLMPWVAYSFLGVLLLVYGVVFWCMGRHFVTESRWYQERRINRLLRDRDFNQHS